jgi:hypothetical protein
MLILFLHGWHGVPGGVKPSYLKDHGHTVINPALPDDDFDAALAIAQAEFDKHKPNVIVGSSRGGALAMNIEAGETPLVLLCPAWKKYGTVKTVKANSTILHSRADDVIPYADSEELVRNSGLPVYVLVETGKDHRLADPESLEIMLEACGRGEDEEVDEESLPINERDWTGLCRRRLERRSRIGLERRAWQAHRPRMVRTRKLRGRDDFARGTPGHF